MWKKNDDSNFNILAFSKKITTTVKQQLNVITTRELVAKQSCKEADKSATVMPHEATDYNTLYRAEQEVEQLVCI